jgi:hypothetical protein
MNQYGVRGIWGLWFYQLNIQSTKVSLSGLGFLGLCLPVQRCCATVSGTWALDMVGTILVNTIPTWSRTTDLCPQGSKGTNALLVLLSVVPE